MIELSEGAKVLVMGPNWLGDCVMAEPAVRLLIEKRPDLDVTLLVPDSLQGIFHNHPQIQKIFPYLRRGKHGGLGGRVTLWRELRERAFDAALILRNSFGAALDASRAGIPIRLGYAAFPRSWFLTEAVPLPPDHKETHRSLAFLGLVKELGIEASSDAPQVFVSDEAAAQANALIASEGGEITHPLVALHPSAAYGPAKMWGVRKYSNLADRFLEEHGATILLLGTEEETEVLSEVIAFAEHAGSREGAVRNLVGKTKDLASLAAVFSCCDLVVGNDSGPVHLAGASGVPTIGIFGSTSSDYTGVQGKQATNLWERYDCSPCFKRDCSKEDYMACMDAVPVARVFNTARDLLGLEEEDFEEIAAAVGDAQGIKDEGS
jgi:heptosyltransferase-2